MDEEVKEPELGNSDNSDMPENSNVETESQANWSDSFSEADKKMILDKGWKSPQDMFKSYQEIEKFASNKISIPKADDAEAWKKLDAKLGCPETIEGYELTDVAEVDKLQFWKRLNLKKHLMIYGMFIRKQLVLKVLDLLK